MFHFIGYKYKNMSLIHGYSVIGFFKLPLKFTFLFFTDQDGVSDARMVTIPQLLFELSHMSDV